ncbi:MAG: SBBP repeat-containing protein, partial [Terracidiphilus sp.]
MHKICFSLLSLTFLAGASGQSPALRTLATMPQGFEPNRGQADRSVDFISRGPGYTLSLTADSANLQLVSPATEKHSAALRLRLVDANHEARAEGMNRQQGKSNYFLGNDSRRWLTDVPQFGRVEYRGVYPGIDVAYHGNNQQLEYDFLLAPHADPRRIRLAVDGADRVQIDPAGDLVLTVGSDEIRERKPVIYQETLNGRRVVTGHYIALDGNQVGFELGNYDANTPLVIDPVINFSTFFGSTGADSGLAVTLDPEANVYMCGAAGAGTFHGTDIGSPGFTGNETAAYVVKVSSTGTLISSTFISGASDTASATGVALDGNGNIYLTGNTNSASFPTLNAVQKTYGGGGDGFVLELNSAANALVYSTYLGGTGYDVTYAIGVDSFGNTLVSGFTLSKNFPVHNATQSTLLGSANAFATKIAPGGSSFVYSTYFGGTGAD